VHDDEPVELEAAIGNGREGYYEVRWREGRLEWRCGDEAETFAPSREEWRAFWRALDLAGVWEWRERYESPGVADGRYWLLRAEHGGRRVDSTGANGYPGTVRARTEPSREFERFCVAVGRLCGGRPFR